MSMFCWARFPTGWCASLGPGGLRQSETLFTSLWVWSARLLLWACVIIDLYLVGAVFDRHRTPYGRAE